MNDAEVWDRVFRHMEILRNAGRATSRTLAYAARATWAHARGYWKVEILLVIGLGLSYVLFAQESDGSTPRLVTAFLIPAGGLCLAAVVSFVLVLAWSPFRNHKELCKQRDDLELKLKEARAEDEVFRRWLHLRHWAHNWAHSFGNMNQRLEGVIRRPDETFDLAHHFHEHQEHLRLLRKELDHLGQPTLKDKFADPDDLEEPQTRQAFKYLVQEGLQQARLIASGYPPPPPFEGPAPEVALKMPNLYSIV